MKAIRNLLAEHKFFQEIPEKYLDLIAGCGRNVHFKAGEFVAHEGDPANTFYLIRSGRISINLETPARGAIRIQTLSEGDILGWGWIFPPHTWTFDMQVLRPTSAIALDGLCLRDKCEKDGELGYSLMKQFAKIMTERLHAARIQLLDLYAEHA